MSAVVLDTGALLQLERNNLDMWTLLQAWAKREVEVLVPSTVLAQTWRGSRKQARLAHALEGCSISPFDPLARQVGVLCGRAKTSDVCDAHVALVAATSADAVFTSDPKDIARLLAFCSPGNPAIVRV
jgi:rRNA-processing protein FCF1